MKQIAVIGGGPAGLRAAEVAAAGGARVTLYEAKASVGRKFLVAGRGGLNLTKAEPREVLATHYGDAGRWAGLLAEGDAEAVRAWAAGLGVETFAASTGRVYPRELKAAPLLRRWVQRLRGSGVHFAVRHRWTGLRRAGAGWQVEFAGPDGARVTAAADAVVLALGGGSWPETGSDGAWTGILTGLGVGIAPLVPANCGWECAWPEAVRAGAGQPWKNVVVRAGQQAVAGELLVTDYGLEGGALYQLGPALRAMAEPRIVIDFKPLQTTEQLAKKLTGVRRELLATAGQRWRLGGAALALIEAQSEGVADAAALAGLVKNCAVPLTRPRPLAEAISSAGGVRWEELDERLMVRRLPGVFVAGEMVDWEAPTGGYLITGCWAMGTRAGRAALVRCGLAGPEQCGCA